MASSIHDGVTSRSTPGIEAKIHPQQSPPMASSMHDEGLQLHAQLYEFMPQPHHHQQDYGYNPQFFSASGEDFMSSLIGTDLRIPEFAYAYIQSMPISLFPSFHQSIVGCSSTNDFM